VIHVQSKAFGAYRIIRKKKVLQKQTNKQTNKQKTLRNPGSTPQSSPELSFPQSRQQSMETAWLQHRKKAQPYSAQEQLLLPMSALYSRLFCRYHLLLILLGISSTLPAPAYTKSPHSLHCWVECIVLFGWM
jgi:hypothetical protein